MATFVTARPVLWADGELAPADAIRIGHAALMTPGATSISSRGGVLPGPGNPGLISALGTPAMKVNVKAGPYEVPSSSATGGSYTVVVDADTDLDIAASDASNPRTDLLIAEVVDNGDATTTYQVRVLTGTAGPGAPRPTNTTPNAHWITIGSVDVRALAESSGFIRAQDVHPERLFTVARGGIVPVGTQAERDALTGYEGLYVDRADTDTLERYSGTAWVPVAGRTCEATVTLGPTSVAPSTVAALGPVVASEVGGDFSVSTFDVVVPLAGVYAIAPRVSIASDPTGRCFVNVITAGATHRLPSALEAITAGTVTARLAAGGTVKIEYFHTAATTQSVSGSLLIARLTP